MSDTDRPKSRTRHCDRFARQDCFERLDARKWDNLLKRRPGATGFYDRNTREGVIYWEISPFRGIIREVQYRDGYLQLPPRRRVLGDGDGPAEEEGVHDD